MSRSSPKMRDYTYGGGERLIQLRQFALAAIQLKQESVGSHDRLSPYTEKL
jgi:hypothetical protein